MGKSGEGGGRAGGDLSFLATAIPAHTAKTYFPGGSHGAPYLFMYRRATYASHTNAARTAHIFGERTGVLTRVFFYFFFSKYGFFVFLFRPLRNAHVWRRSPPVLVACESFLFRFYDRVDRPRIDAKPPCKISAVPQPPARRRSEIFVHFFMTPFQK